MVQRADRLIAVFDGKKGGTANTIRMAHEKGLELRILSPVPAQLVNPSADDVAQEPSAEIKLFD